ncbi:hypothetical protein Tco_1369552 [Tanacetum coccineum]
MSNTNTSLQTQTSNALHNAIMEAGSKDHPPMLAPEGGTETTTEGYIESYKNVSQDIRNQLDAEVKAIERLKHGKSINVQDLETNLYWEFRKFTSRDEWQRFVTLVKQSQELKTISYHKLYDILKQQQNEVNERRAERLASTANPLALDSTPRINRGTWYDSQRVVNVVGARENVEQADWRDDTDDEPDDQVQNDDDNYNVFANDREHPEQPESVNDTYLEEQGDTNITTDSLDMSNNGETVD